MPLHSDLTAWAMPTAARDEWLALAATLDELDDSAVPCRAGDPADWWPDRRDLDGPATHGAVADCHRCPAEAACLGYALAADERFGVWGGLLPDERKALRRAR